jgi:predicted NACHT family NTPase
MTQPIYNWKRFWCLRDGGFHIDANGFLVRSEYFKDTFEFESIAEIPCLVLLGEPGIGKSRALKDAVQFVSTTVGDDKWFSLDLRSFGSETRLYDAIFKSKEMEEWLSGTHRLHLFLDSFDECLLRVDTVATLLADELKPEKYPINRLSFRIASRTAEFPRSLENHLRETWGGKENFQVYELCPLQASDVWEAAAVNDISPEDFFKEIVAKNAGTLAARPITLRFLLNLYQKNNRFPDKLTELYEQGCRVLCDEQNEERRTSGILKGSLTANQRLIIAARIAAVMVFCNKIAVWKEAETGDNDETDVLLRELSGFSEESDNLGFSVTEDAVRETLVQTGLFTARGANRLGWAHQTFAEFLAAWYVAKHNLETEQVLSLITHPADTQRQITPQLQETAAWLASLRADIFDELLETNPILLLRSDVASFSADLRAKLVDELLKLFAEEKASDLGLNYRRLKHPGLAAQLLVVIKDREANYLARRFAIDVAEACELRELQNNLADIILDDTEPDYVRANAGYALWRVGDAETRKRIKHFALNGSQNDKDERVRGVALLCNWDENMSAEEAFVSLVHSPQLHD